MMGAKASETCRAYLWLLIKAILPELHFVGLLYIIRKAYFENAGKHLPNTVLLYPKKEELELSFRIEI